MRVMQKTKIYTTDGPESGDIKKVLDTAMKDLKHIFSFEGKPNFGSWTIFVQYNEDVDNGWDG